MSQAKEKRRSFQAPKGTRDLYPEDQLRRRYVTHAWRDAAIRCGFDEIEGPTFEHADLYAVKSGPGILSELFQAFSGKSPEEIEHVRDTGQAPFALRPEFTPTLARMYAARARQLPKPCKWFTAGPYFRAERPQRGRLREFLQWNCDVIGDDGSPDARAEADADCIECATTALLDLGLDAGDFTNRVSDRRFIAGVLGVMGVAEARLDDVFRLLDQQAKLPDSAFRARARALDVDLDALDEIVRDAGDFFRSGSLDAPAPAARLDDLARLRRSVADVGLADHCVLDLSIVRGLAYYTGAVFEVIAQGERAVAGGGRYDGLVELMGGPATPAVGFAMGDVVLGLLLEDNGLIPEGAELMDAVGRPPASVRPELFVLPNGDEQAEPEVRPLVARLRRGLAAEDWAERAGKPWDPDRYRVRPLHARASYKSTRNLKKLLADAERQHARFAAIIHAPDKVQLKDLDRRADIPHPGKGDFSVDPEEANYVGAEVARRLGERGEATER